MRVTVIMIVLLSLITFVCDWYIGAGINRKYGKKSWQALSFWGFSLLMLVALVVILCYPKRGEGGIMTVMWTLYAYLSVLIPEFIIVLLSAIGLIPSIFGRKFLPLGKFVGIPLGIIIFLAMWWGATFGRKLIQVEEVTIESQRLPKAFDGYRIVQFSDVHVGSWGNDTTFIANLVDSINSLKPDVIFFTGDIVNRETKELLPFVNTLSRLHAKDGVYSVLGNHDYGDYKNWATPEAKDENMNMLKQLQRRMGWKLLNNEHVFLYAGGDSIAVIGVENWGEPPFKQYGNLDKAYSCSRRNPDNVNDGKFKILLSHNPEHWNQHVSHETNIDLTLSGHTHAMQIAFGRGKHSWSPAMYIYEQWGGLYQRSSAEGQQLRIYVNIGCGEVGMPYRIGADSEITLLTLRRKP